MGTKNLDEIITGLTEIREFLADHPDLPPILTFNSDGLRLHLFPHDLPDDADVRREFARCARTLMAGAPLGSITKEATNNFQRVTRKFGPVDLILSADRSTVCKRRVIGVEKVKVPDPAAPQIEVEREIVEWDCEPILAVDAVPA